MSIVTKRTVATTILASSFLLSGCGLFGGEEKSSIDPPKEISLVEDATDLEDVNSEETTSTDSEETTGTDSEKTTDADGDEEAAMTVKTELYLIDKNGYVVPQTLELPKSEGVAKQALEYLVENGPVTEQLPNGFRAVLPADTQLSVNIKEGVATVNFSPEFKKYQKEDELKILQSITWTLTQFDSVETVILKINGEELTEMPVNGTPIQDGLSRATGINLDVSDVTDISDTNSLTVYYIGGETDNYYYVPVTKRISENEMNQSAAVVEELVKGPSSTSNLLSVFMPDVALIEEPKLADGKLTLNFNENILGSFEEKKVSKNVLDSLVLSLTEQTGINSVEVLVQGNSELLTEDGEPISEAVSRPEKVNTGNF
jgi:germination protein M